MDIWQYINPAGNVYTLNDNTTTLKLAEDGCGLDDLELLRNRYALQHGETTKGLYLPPRQITLGIGRRAATLAALQTWEAQFAHWLNPFRTSEAAQSYLQVIRTAGYTRRITARLVGYTSSTKERTAGIYVARLLKWSCDFPFFFDPTQIVMDATLGPAGGMTFPLTFPLAFTATNIDTYLYPNNDGDIETWPNITITGPGTNPTITNDTTGKTMALTGGGGFTLDAGDTVQVDMQHADVWWYDASAGTTTRITQKMSTASAFWYLEPGSNTVRVQMASANNGGIRLTYYNWYWWA